MRVKFLLLTIRGFESSFYGRVGQDLVRLRDEVEHVTVSRRASEVHLARGIRSRSLPELAPQLTDGDSRCSGGGSSSSTASGSKSSTAQIRIMPTGPTSGADARALDDLRADLIVPEVGRETPRLAAVTNLRPCRNCMRCKQDAQDGLGQAFVARAGQVRRDARRDVRRDAGCATRASRCLRPAGERCRPG